MTVAVVTGVRYESVVKKPRRVNVGSRVNRLVIVKLEFEASVSSVVCR